MKRRTWTDQQLISIIQRSTSVREVLIQLALKPSGGNYSTIKSAILSLQIDVSHFVGKGWSKGKSLQAKRPIEDYLSNKQSIQSFKLKNRLLKEKILQAQCSNCFLTQWLSEPIPLELDHINGDNADNSLSNLRLLCPNCHAKTSTYRGKNKKK